MATEMTVQLTQDISVNLNLFLGYDRIYLQVKALEKKSELNLEN